MRQRRELVGALASIVLLLSPALARAQEGSVETDDTLRETGPIQGADGDSEETGPAWENDDDGDEDDDDELGDEIAPNWDDDDEYGDEIAPSWDDDDEYGDEIAPAWDDDEYGDEIAPAWDDDEYGDEIAPTWGDDDDADYSDEIAPTWDDDDDADYSDEIAPAWDDDDDADYSDEIAPTWDEENGDDQELAPGSDTPPGDTESHPPTELGEPAPGNEPDPAPGESDWEVEWTEEDEYYDQFWDELDAEESAEEEAPPEELATDTGRVEGVVVDDEFGSALVDALVTLDGTDISKRIGASGRFFFDVDEGLYVLRVTALGYRTQAYQVEVRPNEISDIGQIRLEVDQATVTTILVEARADRNTQATQMMRRREAATVSDGISAEEMARTPDSTADDAARRVVAATIVDGRYLLVRGLGGRYTRVLLNGVTVPSTDPDFPSVQLDLFPASLLASLTIAKTFTPDVPGDFAGGLMNISTRDFPEQFQASLSASVSGDTETTFQHWGEWHTYDGGGLDFLGFDDGTRSLPDAVPDDARVEAGRGFSSAEVERIGESFPNIWQLERVTAAPNLNLSGSVGDTVQLDGRDLVTLGYSNSRRFEEGVVRDLRLQGEGAAQELAVRQELDQVTGTQDVLWGTLGTISYAPAENHGLSLVTFYSQSAQDRTQRLLGYSEQEGTDIDSTHFEWVERSIWFNQILGSHRHLFLDATLAWHLSAALASREQPDTRDLTYQEGPSGSQFRAAPGSGERFFTDLGQTDLSAGLDLDLPFSESVELGVGGEGRLAMRSFDARRFRFEYIGDSAQGRLLPPEVLFGEASVGVNTELVEVTVPTDGYEADQYLAAAYLMLDWSPVAALRLVSGARFEQFHQEIASDSPFATQSADPDDQTDRTDTDVLPAFSAILSFGDEDTPMFVRAGYGGTVARPQVRELAPFLFQDYVRRRTVEGNPDLQRTYVHNADLRWEFFPAPTEVLAVSLFYKRCLDPIEPVILDRNGNITYLNVGSATNYGAELEARLSLGRLSEALSALSLGANLSVIHSEVTLTEDQQLNATSSERPLAGQSPFVANVSLGVEPPESGFQASLFYNVFGRRIEDVGRLGLPDVYREPVHSLDLNASYALDEHWRLKLNARNLLQQADVLTQEDIEIQRLERGTSFSLGVGWSY